MVKRVSGILGAKLQSVIRSRQGGKESAWHDSDASKVDARWACRSRGKRGTGTCAKVQVRLSTGRCGGRCRCGAQTEGLASPRNRPLPDFRAFWRLWRTIKSATIRGQSAGVNDDRYQPVVGNGMIVAAPISSADPAWQSLSPKSPPRKLDRSSIHSASPQLRGAVSRALGAL
jgi:hypothetical protein